MKDYYSFIYLDNDSIDILYPQVFGDITERSIIHSSEESIDASINANILTVLGANTNSKENNMASESIKFVTSTPRKAQLLIKHFQSNIVSIQDIIENCQPFDESLCFVGSGIFFLSDIYDNKTGNSLFQNTLENCLRRINLDDRSVLIMESGNTDFIIKNCSEYMNSDNYYKSNQNKNINYGLIMHMSNTKIKKDIRHLTWEIKKAKHFKFYVFGELIKSSDRFYQISPFAIWQ